MKLILENGYPFPFPEAFDSDAYECREFSVTLKDIHSVEWLHDFTVKFNSEEAAVLAKELTGWVYMTRSNKFILLARTSADDGYNHPAIVVKDKAYCGFILTD